MATVSQTASLQGRRGLMVVPVRRQSAGPPRNPRKWRQFRRSQPLRDGEASSGPRKTSLRWTSQEPTKVATVSQIAAPQGAARSHCDLRKTYLRWTPQEPAKVATVAQIAAPPQGTASYSYDPRT